MSILVLDNYDSFTYNLVHIIRELGYGNEMKIFRNDKVGLEAVEAFDKILLSPGPGLPSEAGIMPELIRTYAPGKSILGICLGHQGIAEAFGGSLYNMETVMHGIESRIHVHEMNGIFRGTPDHFKVGRYHSWSVVKNKLPDELHITAEDEEGVIMGIRHKQWDVQGLQFHPESIISEHGKHIMKNWIEA